MLKPTEEGLRKSLPGLRGFLSIEQAGHWPQLEVADQVNGALLNFLKGLTGPG